MPHSSREVIDLTDDEQAGSPLSPQETLNLLGNFFDLTIDERDEAIIISDNDNDLTFQSRSLHSANHIPSSTPRRNAPVSPPWVIIPELKTESFTLRPEKSVQLRSQDFTDGDFLCIHSILKNLQTDAIKLRGHLLRRTTQVVGMLPRKLNDVYLVADLERDDPRSLYVQSMVEVSLCDILKTRKIVFTHENFPRYSFREDTILDQNLPGYQYHRQVIKDSSKLVCRYVVIRRFDSEKQRLSEKNVIETEIRKFFVGETPFNHDVYTPPNNRAASSNSARTVNGKGPKPQAPRKEKKYTYGTGFCGAGGDAAAARSVGYRIAYGWDACEKACETFRRNHGHTAEVHHMTADDFYHSDYCNHVDHLHLSCPCQYFSPAHTSAGRDDDDNIAALFTTEPMLKKCKPRIHTQEQTIGIVQRHPAYFAALINMIISAGYNVRWRCINFRDDGVSQNRKRVIIFASIVGVPLPKFPEAAYGLPGSGLKPFRTIYDAIKKIPSTATWHLGDVENFREPKPAYDSRTKIAGCITTGGSLLYHPSGLRSFSPREIARIQGFDDNYIFPGTLNRTRVIKQAGNAVPPLAWKRYVESCRKTLEDFDAGLIDMAGNSTNPEGHDHTRGVSGAAFQRTVSLRSWSSTRSPDIEITCVRFRAVSVHSDSANQGSGSTGQIVDLTMDD